MSENPQEIYRLEVVGTADFSKVTPALVAHQKQVSDFEKRHQDDVGRTVVTWKAASDKMNLYFEQHTKLHQGATRQVQAIIDSVQALGKAWGALVSPINAVSQSMMRMRSIVGMGLVAPVSRSSGCRHRGRATGRRDRSCSEMLGSRPMCSRLRRIARSAGTLPLGSGAPNW